MDIFQPIATVVALVSGVSGCLFGILNYLHQRDTTRPYLRIRPKVLTLIDRDSGSNEENVGVVEIANVGHVPVIGSTIGFHKKRKDKKGYIVVSPQPITDGQWPGELKPGNVILLRIKLDSLPNPEELGQAFVKTIVDDIFPCNRRDMKQFQKALADVRKSHSKPAIAVELPHAVHA